MFSSFCRETFLPHPAYPTFHLLFFFVCFYSPIILYVCYVCLTKIKDLASSKKQPYSSAGKCSRRVCLQHTVTWNIGQLLSADNVGQLLSVMCHRLTRICARTLIRERFLSADFSSARDRDIADSSEDEAINLITVTTAPFCVTASHVFVCYNTAHTVERHSRSGVYVATP